MKRYCKECGTPVGKGKSYCEFDLRQTRLKYGKLWRSKNPNYHSEYDAKRTPQKHCNDCGVEVPKGKQYCEVHREERKKEAMRKGIRRYKRKSREDVVFRIAENISNQVHQAMKGIQKNKRTFKSLGYTPEELKQHLERLFKKGMNWDNYGINGWHIDHIIPKTEFPFTSLDDKNFKKCWSLDNLQPLWADENRKKSNKI